MGHTGYRFRPGHRLALAVFSSDFPEFVPHPGTEDNRWTATQVKVSTQTLHQGGSLVLWVMPPQAARRGQNDADLRQQQAVEWRS